MTNGRTVEYTIYGPSDKSYKNRIDDVLPGLDMGTVVLDVDLTGPTLSDPFPDGADTIVITTNTFARIEIGQNPVAGNGTVGAKTRIIGGDANGLRQYYFSVRGGQRLSAIDAMGA